MLEFQISGLSARVLYFISVYIFSISSRSGKGVVRVKFRDIDDISFPQQSKISPIDFNAPLLWLSMINIDKYCQRNVLQHYHLLDTPVVFVVVA